MTQQRTDYPFDYSEGSGDAKDRLREMADNATEHVKGATQSAQEIAGHVAQHMRDYGEKAQHAAKQFKPKSRNL